jgi:60 kDa SS-A/Ro ribonucleoprotein
VQVRILRPYRNGVGYGEWTHIDGWREAVIDYIAELESAACDP